MKKLMFAAVAACAIPAMAKTLAEVPVAETANCAYLTDMDGRLWWNTAWKKRAAILVSNMAKVRADKVAVDFVLDVGEKIDPKEVRVVTPWEREVPCEAEKVKVEGEGEQWKVRILFLTDLREMENRPFFVYWDNPDAQPAKARSGLTLFASDDEIYVNNGAVEVVFDNLHRTDGLVKTLKANGSQAPSLLWRTTGFAWEGFTFETDGKRPAPKLDPTKVRPGNALDAQIHKPDAAGGWSKAIVTADGVLRKTVTFTNEFASLDFTFYAGVPRVDYAYRLAPGLTRANIGMSWASGGGTAHDDFYYPGIAGKVLTQRAALDWVTDCEPAPIEVWRFPWFGKGWYAFADHRTRDVVGMVFDRDALDGVSYLAGTTHSGEAARLRFHHKPPKGECATGGGALVATVGGFRDVEREHELLKSRPRVFVGAVQPYREIVPKRRDLAHDFCVNCNVGGWKSGKPLPGDEWIVNILDHLRERGANTILLGQLTDFGWTELPVPKDLYDRTCAYMLKRNPKWKAPAWGNGNFTGERLRAVCAAAHARGMAVQTWHDALPGIGGGDAFDPEFQGLCREFQALYPKCGVDSTFNALGGGEGTPLPKEVREKYGRSFWKWDDPQPYFDSRRVTAGFMKEFYDYAHKASPDTRVMVFNSDNGELGREMCMPYYPGCMDTLYCEICAQDGDYDKIKHTTKRLRSYFDNEDGRTVCAHYYCMKLDHAYRISENEQPFICGMNAFSQEAMTYENVDPENFQFSADFSRFAGYTRLGEKVAKMGPVKNLAVFRDMDCFEEDARKHRTVRGGWGYDMSRHDARVNGFARIRNYNYDIVMNPFFKVDSLKRYKVVYIPDDEVLSEANAKELLAFVEQGGGAVVEGATREKVEELKSGKVEELGELKDGQVVEYGKGKIVWTKDVLTERLQKRDLSAGEKVKALVASVGGQDPLTIESKTLDGVLQAGAEGMFLGVYNRGKESDTGKVTLNLRLAERAAPLWVLDVKRGVRFAYTNGFEIAVGPRQCGFYLIGDDAFTAIPKTTEAAWTGPSAASAFAYGTKPNPEGGKPFEARHCVEFVTPAPRNFAGQPARIERSERAMLVRHRFCAAEDRMVEKAKADDFEAWMAENALGARCYRKAAFAKALEKASYVHVQCDGKDCDDAFEDCAEELKALLKRGGGILFVRTRPGPKAQKFLADIGVYDPTPSIKEGFEERAVWSPSVSTNHPLIKAKGTWYNSNVGATRKYAKWDKEKQYAPYVDKLHPENALMVIQDDVLGAGKVMFTLNKFCYTSWYENYDHGDGLLSYLLGMPVKEHAEKVQLFNGGPGEVVR